ncbi:MAG TPA: serine/threonine-protein kinase [Candidatus Didemnitutus sp.]|nr:serine/threonine-protein kinase [Candidatus Didemnitutus sp.]
MNTGLQHEEILFDAARRLSDPAGRSAFLTQACAGNPELRSRVETLLTAAEAAEDFFTESSTAVKFPGEALDFLAGVSIGGTSRNHPVGEEPLGSRIGRYKLVRKLGEGGCGVVYLAEQEEPVRRQVALKIIKLGMETKSVIARFEAERQALAMMDHPNIARVYDAGATDRGPPYFVMELVCGIKITEYCDRHQLDIRQRLDLFVQICHAIQHAHQKGIVHGDIKPSNIIVAEHDGLADAKVIDFGISKATEARLTDRTLFTNYAQLIGTPAYMSPEQAAMGGVDIDTRSDIYSLGVLLYELLAGKTPFDGKALLASGLDEMRRTLKEIEPPRPSVRLAALTVDERATTAAARQADPRRLAASLRGDLDWVVMKALEKDRRRRYETANGLALDVQRHLNHEPVSAGPPSWLYRLQKLVRRNRVVFIAGGAVTAALFAGLGTSTWLFLKEREAHQRAVAAEQQQARLRHEAEIREKITQAALLVSQEKFAQADALCSGIVLQSPTVEGAAVLRALGEWHALRERWSQSAERFLQLLQVNQLDGVDGSSLDLLRAGPVLTELSDANVYEHFRQGCVVRFGGTPCPFADRIVKICLLRPVDRKLTEALQPFAETTTKSLAADDASGDTFRVAWESISLALWEYRRGNFATAMQWGRRCLASSDHNAPRSATAHVILAMAAAKLGQREEAEAELAKGREMIEARYRGRDERGTPVQGFWFDWALARILLREAEPSS